jgi:hypothetical protein
VSEFTSCQHTKGVEEIRSAVGNWFYVWGDSESGHAVGVLNPSLVPNQMDVVIGKRYFELKFTIEQPQPAESSRAGAAANDNDGNDDKANEDEVMEDKADKKHKNVGSTSGDAETEELEGDASGQLMEDMGRSSTNDLQMEDG